MNGKVGWRDIIIGIMTVLVVGLFWRNLEVGTFQSEIDAITVAANVADNALMRHEASLAHKWAETAIRNLQVQDIKDSIWRAHIDEQIEAIAVATGAKR